MGSQINIVIPTYNRDSQLSQVFDHLLKSGARDFSLIEIIIIDDGPVICPEPMMRMKYLYCIFDRIGLRDRKRVT